MYETFRDKEDDCIKVVLERARRQPATAASALGSPP
jgi:hypothetical protein